jgi:CHAT domain-containing protein/tetratricopeptide (TPR) repeat protein
MKWLPISQRILARIRRQLSKITFLLCLITSCAHTLFAIPSAPARELSASQPGWLGIELRNLTRKEMQALGFLEPQGAQVLKVEPNSPAAKARLAPGDVIIVAGGRPVVSTRHFLATIRASVPGTAIKLSVLRRGQRRSTTALVGLRPAPIEAPASQATGPAPDPAPDPNAPASSAPIIGDAGQQKPVAPAAVAPAPEPAPAVAAAAQEQSIAPQQAEAVGAAAPAPPAAPGRLGIEMRDVTEEESKELGWSAPRGAKVIGFIPESRAAAEGLREGDIILSANTQDLPDSKRLAAIISAIPAGTRVPFKVFREGEERELTLTLIPRPPKPAAAPVAALPATGQNWKEPKARGVGLPLLAEVQKMVAEPTEQAEQMLALTEKELGPEHPNAYMFMNTLGLLYDTQGRYDDAEQILKRALERREAASGPDHPDTLKQFANLAAHYDRRGHLDKAEPLYRQVLAGREKVLGPEHPDTLEGIYQLGFLYQKQDRDAEAETFYKRALAGQEKVLGREHANTLKSVDGLLMLYTAQARYGEAEPLHKWALAGREKGLGPEHPDTLRKVRDLAKVLDRQGRYSEAEPLYKQALAGLQKVLGPEHGDALLCIKSLASVYFAQGRYREAEPLYKQVLASSERQHGPEYFVTLLDVASLAFLYMHQNRYDEAERLYKRVLASQEKIHGPEHTSTATTAHNLGALYERQGRRSEAEPLYMRAVAIREKHHGPLHPNTLRSVESLAGLYSGEGRYSEAELLYKRGYEGNEKTLGPQHPDTLRSLSNLGWLYSTQGRYAQGEPLLRRASAGNESVLGPEHPNTIESIGQLAAHYFLQRDWQNAALLLQRTTAAVARRTQGGLQESQLTGERRSEAQRFDWQFWQLVKAAYRLASEGRDPGSASNMFENAQWALSSDAAQSLAQMAARGTKGNTELAALVRERQDLLDEWKGREKRQAAARAQESAKRNTKTEDENRERMGAIDQRIGEIDTRFKTEFPDYATLASTAPLSVEDAQAQLGADEALVLFLDTPAEKPTPEETFIWVVTKTDMRWLRSHLAGQALAREVAALRCGLDYTAWQRRKCEQLTGATYSAALYPRELPPFDTARAHRLYKALLGGAEDMLQGKTHLLLVPSGALTQLPPQVLVTEPPTADSPPRWLIRDYAVSVLPAASSLKALRSTARPSAAERPMIGFGNPLLDGPDSRHAARAEEARQKQSCPKTVWERVASLFDLDRGITLTATRGLADPTDIRRQPPLPETADELCAVARETGADLEQIRLGARATEQEVKSLSSSGELARYRVLEFATHGAAAGQLSRDAEPGLILTPPGKASETDDGYLSASEIAGLKLDADWVILSACNTAAGQAASAEALSGLARAFIYAQARALLVSHWEVDSEAAVKLVTTAMREIERNRSVGRAEALRRAMLALIDSGDTHQQAPSTWAPFVVVGEGGR